MLVAISAVETPDVLREVEWPTLAFFAGLFIVAGALIETGVIGEASNALAGTMGGSDLGADLGGNATAIGASANVVVIGIAERSRQPISFWKFTKYGLIVTAVTVGLSAVYLWLRYFAFAGYLVEPADTDRNAET